MIPVLLDLDEKDVVKWILVFLFNRRLTLSGLTLEKESGVMNSEYFLAELRQVILEGDWEKAHKLIVSLIVDEVDSRQIRFLLKRQQVFECFQRWKKCTHVEKSSTEEQQCVQKEKGCFEQDEGTQIEQWCVEQKGYVQKQNEYHEPGQYVDKECHNIYEVAMHHFSELKELDSGDNDFPDLSGLLNFDINVENLNLLEGRIKCFSAIYPLVCKALSTTNDKMTDKTHDRLIELLVKGCFFESLEKYFRRKVNCEEFYANNEPRMKLIQSSDVNVKSLVAKLLSDVDASLPSRFSFTAEMVELNAKITKLERSLDMTHLDSLQPKRVTAIHPTETSLQSSVSDASVRPVCDVDMNQKTKSKEEESPLLLDGISLSKLEVIGDSECQNLEFLPSTAKIMRGSGSEVPETGVGNTWSEGLSLMDVDATPAPEITEVCNRESADNTDYNNTEENLEIGVDLLMQLFKILEDEFRANQSSVKNEVVFRHKQHCCEFCGKLMRSSSEMLRHIRTHRSDADRLVHKCHQCLRLFADESSFEAHKRLHEEPLHCTICQRPFVERVKLQQHVMKNHVKIELLSCIPCKESFLSEAELETHMNRHLDNYQVVLAEMPGVEGETRGKREFACDLCGKRFSGSGALRKHVRSHTQERPYCCTTCGKKFLRLEHLQLHERIHTGEKPFQCKICDYSSCQQNGLKSHMKQHSADNPFSCPGCGKQFSLLCRLKTHLLDATDKSDYSCPVCLVEFQYACALKAHAKTHASQASRTFACDVCSRRFSRKHDMMVHAMLHSNAKPYICAICKSSFSSKSYVKEHLSSHTGDDRCACKACNQEFKDSADLLTHMELHIEGDWLKCRNCDETLANGAEFRKHQRQHCAKKQSGCKRGKQLRDMNCDGEKSDQCSDCGYTTSVQSGCYRHRNRCLKKMKKVKIT